MNLSRRGFIKGLASLALLPSLAWTRLDKLAAPEAVAPAQIETALSWDDWAREFGVVVHEGSSPLVSFANAALTPEARRRMPLDDAWPDSMWNTLSSEAKLNAQVEGKDEGYYTPEEMLILDASHERMRQRRDKRRRKVFLATTIDERTER